MLRPLMFMSGFVDMPMVWRMQQSLRKQGSKHQHFCASMIGTAAHAHVRSSCRLYLKFKKAFWRFWRIQCFKAVTRWRHGWNISWSRLWSWQLEAMISNVKHFNLCSLWEALFTLWWQWSLLALCHVKRAPHPRWPRTQPNRLLIVWNNWASIMLLQTCWRVMGLTSLLGKQWHHEGNACRRLWRQSEDPARRLAELLRKVQAHRHSQCGHWCGSLFRWVLSQANPSFHLGLQFSHGLEPWRSKDPGPEDDGLPKCKQGLGWCPNDWAYSAYSANPACFGFGWSWSLILPQIESKRSLCFFLFIFQIGWVCMSHVHCWGSFDVL